MGITAIAKKLTGRGTAVKPAASSTTYPAPMPTGADDGNARAAAAARAGAATRAAGALVRDGKWDESVEPLRQAIADLRFLQESGDPRTRAMRTGYFLLVGSLRKSGRHREALDAAREALAVLDRPVLVPEPPAPPSRDFQRMFFHDSVAHCLARLGEDDEGQARAAAESVRIGDCGRFASAENSSVAATLRGSLALASDALDRLGRIEDAVAAREREISLTRAHLAGHRGADAAGLASSHAALAVLNLKIERIPAAMAAAGSALDRYQDAPGAMQAVLRERRPDLLVIEERLVDLEQYGAAVEWLTALAPALATFAVSSPTPLARCLNSLAWCLCHLDRAAEAVRPALESVALGRRGDPGDEHAGQLLCSALDTAVLALTRCGRAAEAAPLARECVDLLVRLEEGTPAPAEGRCAAARALLVRIEGRAEGGLLER